MQTLLGIIRRTGSALVLSTVGLACSEALAPSGVAGVYVRSGTDDVHVTSGGTVQVVADTFVVRNDRTGVRRTYVQRTVAGAPTPAIELDESDFSYRLQGRAIGFTYACPGICAAVARPPHWFDFWGTHFVSRGDSPVWFTRRGDVPAP